ncbi:MAG: class I SAM-dependent methyltransferase [Ilumatobacter sp.]|uniref:class I SAM-dependent methyltransferase n=1 Tax=Ilumatobacter sp. TaxID=1967498 RepID=UPI002603E45B|nr:class I SAM-dependent methyltransferase [Ilumatobacter sp.]MDJ0770233.1 class I SAM-dependent methyltransferase [Ilumatobacter sp.]
MDRESWDARYETTDFVWTDRANGFVERHLADLPPGRALDLAAGEGRNSLWLAARGWAVTAVDFSSVGIDKGRRLATERGIDVEWVVADVTEYEPHRPFDLVLIAYLQLALPSRTAVLRRAATWVAPGGSLFVVAHDRSNVEHGHGGPPSIGVCYDLDETVAALNPLAADVAEVATRTVPTPDGDREALDTIVLARR